MSDLGYVTEIIPMAHDEYGGCTIRKRVYLVSLHPKALGISTEEANKIMVQIVKKVEDLKLPSQDFREHLLPEEHPYVQQIKASVVPAETQVCSC